VAATRVLHALLAAHAHHEQLLVEASGEPGVVETGVEDDERWLVKARHCGEDVCTSGSPYRSWTTAFTATPPNPTGHPRNLATCTGAPRTLTRRTHVQAAPRGIPWTWFTWTETGQWPAPWRAISFSSLLGGGVGWTTTNLSRLCSSSLQGRNEGRTS
jgi:hypothetical protein